MTFRFKQFNVEDDQSSMRVGTDAILLGAWADLSSAINILDAGTGCGVIALMLAQRSTANITAIDIHKDSVDQAILNFKSSPWKDRLKAIHISCQEFGRTSEENFDLVISNPPFFIKSLKSPDPLKNMARHDDLLSSDELLEAVFNLFNKHRPSAVSHKSHSLIMVIPFSQKFDFETKAHLFGLYLRKQLVILPKPGKPANRILLELSDQRPLTNDQAYLTLRNTDNSFSDDYRELTKEYYLNL